MNQQIAIPPLVTLVESSLDRISNTDKSTVAYGSLVGASSGDSGEEYAP
jgi:hypothetical protein